MKSNESGKRDNGGSLNLEDIQRLGFLDKNELETYQKNNFIADHYLIFRILDGTI